MFVHNLLTLWKMLGNLAQTIITMTLRTYDIQGTTARLYFQGHDWLNFQKYSFMSTAEGNLAVLQIALAYFDLTSNSGCFNRCNIE